MPGTGTLTFYGTLIGYPTGSRTINIIYPIVSSSDDSISIALQVGDNEIAIPSGVTGVIIDPPPGNPVIVRLSGAPGSVGVGLNPTFATIWMIAFGEDTFTLNAPSLPPGDYQITYF